MRSRYHWVLSVAVLAVASGAPGQEKGDKGAVGPKNDPNSVEVRFADDSILKVVLQDSRIEVVTRYGKLAVPAGEIRRIEFGLRVPEDSAKRIEAAVARLGNPDFKQREAAVTELLELRELAYQALQKAASSADAEVARRAKDGIKVLVETVPAEKLHLPRHDAVVALDFTIVGQVAAASFKVRTPYF